MAKIGLNNLWYSKLTEANDWTWQPNRDGPDLYDVDTGYYHKTICFAKPIQI